jgi:hypothetical protein
VTLATSYPRDTTFDASLIGFEHSARPLGKPARTTSHERISIVIHHP